MRDLKNCIFFNFVEWKRSKGCCYLGFFKRCELFYENVIYVVAAVILMSSMRLGWRMEFRSIAKSKAFSYGVYWDNANSWPATCEAPDWRSLMSVVYKRHGNNISCHFWLLSCAWINARQWLQQFAWERKWNLIKKLLQVGRRLMQSWNKKHPFWHEVYGLSAIRKSSKVRQLQTPPL